MKLKHSFVLKKLLPSILMTLVLATACKKKNVLPPPSLSISNISDTGCVVNWTAVSGATAYSITIASDPQFSNIVAGYNNTSVTSLAETVTNLTPYTKYYVKMVAFNNQQASDGSVANLTTLDADHFVILGGEDKLLYALDARNGNIKWTFLAGGRILAAPTIDGNVVYVGGEDGRLYAINLNNGSLKWKTGVVPTATSYVAPATVKDSVVYIGDFGGRFYAYNAVNGTLKWSYSVPSPYANIGTAAVVDNGTVYFASYDGKVYALNASGGTLKWVSTSTGNPITTGMALQNGNLYLGATPKVYCLDAATGAGKWVTPAPQYTTYSSSPTLANNTVYIGGEDGIFYAFDDNTGAIKWSKSLQNGSIMSSPLLLNNQVFVGGGNGILYCLDAFTGNIVWSNTISPQNVYSGPTLGMVSVYAGGLNGNIVAMRRQDGLTKWITSVPGVRFSSSPEVITYSGKIFHPGVSGHVQ